MPPILPLLLPDHMGALQSAPSTIGLSNRQNSDSNNIIIPTTYGAQDSSPQPGVVAGIVLGSVGGFLLVVALLYSCLGWAPVAIPTAVVSEGSTARASRSVLSFRTRSTKKRRAAPVRATETFEVRTRQHVGGREPPPPAAAIPLATPGPSRAASAARPQPVPRIVREDEDDEVVVIEEHDPPRRKSRRHSSTIASDDRRYRDTDRDPRRDSRRYSRDR